MVSVATRSRFASHKRSPPAPNVASGHRGARPVAVVAITVPSGSRPPLSHPVAVLLPLELLLPVSAARLPHHPVVDNGNSAPRLDASAAKKTSPVSPLRYVRPPRPTARTGAVSRHSLAGSEIAVGFESRQTAALQPLPQPLFWRHFGTCFFSYH